MSARGVVALALAACALACKSGAPFEGLAPAQPTSGPHVVVDLTRKPLPELPFPNDLFTLPDATSATGLRLNASLIAPTRLEQRVRSLLDGLDGFGTFAPITVAFDAELDVLDLLARQNDGDPTNDGVYVVDLATGALAPLDLGDGRFPLTLPRGDQYFLNDPLAAVRNLLFPVSGPFANFLHPVDPAWPAAHAGNAQEVDDLATFYERSTHTLIIRTAVPLEQQHRYAVVLTSRIKGTSGAPIGSPFPGINHALQTEELRPLLSRLPPGVQLGDIAFAWAFTTQSVTRDLEALHDGLSGLGSLRQLYLQYPVQAGDPSQTGAYRTLMKLQPEVDGSIDAAASYILPAAKVIAILKDPRVGAQVIAGGINSQDVQALADTLRYVDYFVSGTYFSPDLVGQPDRNAADGTIQIDQRAGTVRARLSQVPFFLAVPKANGSHVAPFPVALYSHGYTSTRFEGVLGFSGTMAKYGIATAAIDSFGHGLTIKPVLEALKKTVPGLATPKDAVDALTGLLAADPYHMGAFASVLFTGRARDLDNDGIPDSGGDFWRANPFHTRDVIRQTVVDWMQFIRVLRSFDGHGTMHVSPNQTFLAGDFNNDCIPDVGGTPVWAFDIRCGSDDPNGPPRIKLGTPNPGSDLFAWGISLGGIMSSVLAAVTPEIRAVAPVSSGGGLTDVSQRSTLDLVVNSVFLEVMGPLLVNCRYNPADGTCGGSSGDPALVLQVQDLTAARFLPIAPIALAAGDTVTVRNLSQADPAVSCDKPGAAGCYRGTTDANGQLRISFAADWPFISAQHTPPPIPGYADGVTAQLVQPGDALVITVAPASGAAPVTINTFRYPFLFYGIQYNPGDPLVAPAGGLGLPRNTPQLRRELQLAQTILEPADPVNYAPHYFQSPLPVRTEADAGVVNTLLVETVGDTTVPIATGLSLARAAGFLPVGKVDPDFGTSLDQVLLNGGVNEGLADVNRFGPDGGALAALGAHVRCPAGGCPQGALLDPTGYSCDAHGQGCTDGFAAPRLDPSLRQKLVIQMPGADGGVSALMLPYLDPKGQHAFFTPMPHKPFDVDSFMANAIGRFFETRGAEVHFEPCQAVPVSADAGQCPWILPPPP